MTPAEDEDTTRYHFAQGSLLLRGLADRVSRVFYEGRAISEDELRQMHADLNAAWGILISETIHGIAPEDGSAEPWDLEHHRNTYSDGSSVATVAMGYSDQMTTVPLHFRERHITHLPGYTGDDHGYLDTPYEVGSTELHLPPHERPVATGMAKPSRKTTKRRPRAGTTSTSGGERASGTSVNRPTLAERLAKQKVHTDGNGSAS